MVAPVWVTEIIRNWLEESKPYICVQTNYRYLIGIVTWNDIIIYKLLVLDRNTWNDIIIYKLLEFDRNN